MVSLANFLSGFTLVLGFLQARFVCEDSEIIVLPDKPRFLKIGRLNRDRLALDDSSAYSVSL